MIKDLEFIKIAKENINITLAKYIQHPQHNNFINDASAEEVNEFLNLETEYIMQYNTFNIQYSLLLDMVLNDIRNATISYKVGKNRTEDSKIKKVQSLIIEAESELNLDPTNINSLTKIERLQNEYSDLLEGKKAVKFSPASSMPK